LIHQVGHVEPGHDYGYTRAIAVTFTLVVNLARGYPLLSVAASGAIAAIFYALWARAGRPAGVEEVERHVDDAD